MKKTETNISAVRGRINASKSIVKIKRYSLNENTNFPRVTFNLPNCSSGKTAISLPINYTDEQLKETQISNETKSDNFSLNKAPRKVLSTKKRLTPPKRMLKSIPHANTQTSDSSTQDMQKLLSEFMAVEERLNDLQSNLTKNVNEKLSKFDHVMTKLESFPLSETDQKATGDQKDVSSISPPIYNASDYELDRNFSTNEKNTHLPQYISERVPIKPESALNSDYDIKLAIEAIRSDLNEWRRSHQLITPTVSSFNLQKTATSSSESYQPKSEVLRDIAEKEMSTSSDSREAYVSKDSKQPEVPQEAKSNNFPLDRFLENKSTLLNSSSWLKKSNEFKENAAIKKKINDLAIEAAKITEGVVPFISKTNESPKSTSISIHESESSYTEHLVETKFKEVNFKRPGKTMVKNDANKRSMIYSPKHYEESSFGVDISPLYKLEKESKPSPTRIVKKNSYRSFSQQQSPQKVNLMLSKSSSTATKSIKTRNYAKENTLSNKNKGKEKLVSKKNFHVDDGLFCLECIPQSRHVEPSRVKHFHDASINTEKNTYPNNTLINVTSVHDMETEISPKLYQVQELPSVNIRPNLTKQSGPSIDIIVPKQFPNTNNVALVEFTHADVQHNKKHKNFCFSDYTKLKESFSSLACSSKSSRELRLQKTLKEMLKKLNRKGPYVDQLRNAINILVGLLNKIVPFHTASIRIQDGNISLADESIDLLFMNMDIVQEVIDHELNNPIETFCKYPNYILKAVKLLCGNIRSIFDVSDTQHVSVKTSINNYIGKENERGKIPALSSKNGISNVVSHASSEIPFKPILRESTSTTDSNKDNFNPKNIYIPYRKLVPGGMFKEMEDAESLSEVKLRKKRLEKIHKINKHLRSEFIQQKEMSLEENSKSENNMKEILNETFVIDSGNQKENEKPLSKNGSEFNKKSEVDYEEDWEPEVATSNDSTSKTDEMSLQMENLIVEVEVHSGEEAFQKKEVYTSENSSTTKNNVESCQSSVSNLHIKATTYSQSNKILENTNKNKSNPLVSVGIQTDELIKTSESPNSIKKNVFIETNNEESSVPEINPILRIRDPTTNALLEVRFPEQTESYQNSLHFQKTENKEEIKLSFIRHQGKIKEDTDNNTKEVITEGDKSFVKNEVIKSETIDNTKGISNDLENITLGFVDFLENKLTEMVSKFKLSERLSEKLITDKITCNKEDPQCSLKQMSNDSLHSNFNSKIQFKAPIYKSNSSLFSENSNNELKPFKNTASRGCTPDYGLIKFDSLISPPLNLQLKRDMPTQTELLPLNTIQRDACVGTSENSLGVTDFRENIFINRTEDIKCKQIVQINLLSPDDGLRWCSPDVENTSENKSQTRLLPLPDEVLKINDLLCPSINPQKKIASLATIHTQNTNLNHKEIQVSLKDNACDPQNVVEEILDKNDIAHISFSDNSSKEKSHLNEERVIPLSKEDATVTVDSQRTSQIAISLSTADISTIQYMNSSVPPQLSTKNNDTLSITEKGIFGAVSDGYLKNSPSFDCDDNNFIRNEENVEDLNSISNKLNCDENVELSHAFGNSMKNSQDGIKLENDDSLSKIKNIGITVWGAGSLERDISFREKHIGHNWFNSSKIEQSKLSLQAMHYEFQPEKTKFPTLLGDNNFHKKDGEVFSIPSTMNLQDFEIKLKQSHLIEDTCSETNDSIASKSSSLSEEFITIYYYNSDEMSDGEIGFHYTSNSYSSGEIKPVQTINCEDIPDILDDKSEINSLENHGNLPTACSTERPSLESNDKNLECGDDKNHDSFNTLPMVFESSSSGSISTGELQKLLDANDKLDEVTLRKLLDNNLVCSGRSSPGS